ncbi:MAG: hypothetical protein EBS05_11540 [Proteobacteria bacterium]|nr:hypothetical protein [Pseudomonadota bacterium]NDA68936.1 hypothetical protein [Verrucomicrobiota bacterium]NDD40624.1 hypothetical protein [Verrucomicrobiota bacterium]NDF01015.1 hypothetical protein [Verrucomicrobiota bacterium]
MSRVSTYFPGGVVTIGWDITSIGGSGYWGDVLLDTDETPLIEVPVWYPFKLFPELDDVLHALGEYADIIPDEAIDAARLAHDRHTELTFSTTQTPPKK